MKKLGIFNKIVYILNLGLTVLSLLAYLLPFFAPKLFPILSVLTLFLPLMLILNALFFLYWLIQLKRQMLLSAMVLLIGLPFINKFYRFTSKSVEPVEDEFTFMSYNVRLFNLFEWMPKHDVNQSIANFIKEQNPDIICFQEYSGNHTIDFKLYPFSHEEIRGKSSKYGQAIYSKYPIIHKGHIALNTSDVRAIYADIKRGKDTLRVYSLHLQSIKITPDIHEIENNLSEGVTQERSLKMLRNISSAFREQQQQAEIIQKHRSECHYPVIFCGDFNNSAFSYVYRKIKGDLNDSFEKAGKGFGKTYNFKFYPARIDYIFSDKRLEVRSHQNFPDFVHSDHFPLVAKFSFKK